MPYGQSKISVSVIVPVFNREDVIQRAVSSLLRQNFRYPFEIIVIDDGSTDRTVQKILDLNSERVRLVQQKNRGASAARYTGMIHACADVLAFLDSDDIAEPLHLKTLWEKLHKRRDVVLSYARVCPLNRTDLPGEKLPEVNRDGILEDPLSALLEVGCFVAAMNIMTYRKIALRCAKDRQHILAANDYDLCLRIARFGPFAYSSQKTILIDRRDDGIGRKIGYKQVGFSVIVAFEAFMSCGRKEKRLLRLLKQRISLQWPTAIVQLMSNFEVRLAAKVFFIALRFGHPSDIKRLYWAIDHQLKTRIIYKK